MSNFTKPLIISPLDSGRRFKIVEDYSYDVGSEGSGETIRIPVGFQTDLASIPRGLWNVIPVLDRHLRAAVVHDWLYSNRNERQQVMVYKNGDDVWRKRSRKECDDIFLEAMIVCGVGKVKRQLMYRAVRVFGWIAWNRK